MSTLTESALALAADLGGPILCLDSSASPASVAAVAFCPGAVEEREPTGREMPSESLSVDVAELFARNNVSPAELASIFIGIGPGSFTGLRVGLALVKGLALGAGCGVHPVSSLALLAAGSRRCGETVSVVVDAQRGERYVGRYVLDSRGAPRALEEDRCVVAEGGYSPPPDDVLVGDVDGAAPAVPRALAALVMCEEQVVAGTIGVSLQELSPRYLKVAEAERQRVLKARSQS